jgi:hypothetical protein
MSRSKAKSNYKISLPEAILNLSNINYKPKNIAQCLSMAFANNVYVWLLEEADVNVKCIINMRTDNYYAR